MRGDRCRFLRSAHDTGCGDGPYPWVVLDRDAVLASLNDAPPWDRYTISDERLIELTEHTAALVYTGRASRVGEAEFHALMSSVYRRHNGEWRLVLYQQTPISGPEESWR